MSCLFYDRILGKDVPCTIVPNVIFVFDDIMQRKYLCNVTFDDTSLATYGLTSGQISKYSGEYVNIHDLYPADTQDDIDYYHSCITTNAVDNAKELARFEKLYLYLTSTTTISTLLIYSLCNFIITDLQFKFLTHDQRVFMLSLSGQVYTTLPDIPTPEFARMILNLFDKSTGDSIFPEHVIDNVNHITAYDYIFPLTLNVENIRSNLNFFRDQNPTLFA